MIHNHDDAQFQNLSQIYLNEKSKDCIIAWTCKNESAENFHYDRHYRKVFEHFRDKK